MFKSGLPTTHPVSHMGCPQIIRVHPKMKIHPAASTPSHSHHPKSSSWSLGIPSIRARCQPYNTALLPGVTGFTAPPYAVCRAAFREHPTCPTPQHSRLCTSHPHHLCIPGTKFTAPTPPVCSCRVTLPRDVHTQNSSLIFTGALHTPTNSPFPAQFVYTRLSRGHTPELHRAEQQTLRFSFPAGTARFGPSFPRTKALTRANKVFSSSTPKKPLWIKQNTPV